MSDAAGEADAPETTRDGFLGGQLVLRQPRSGAHRAGLDGVLLAAAVPEGTRGRLLDMGAGVGVAGLAAAVRLPHLAVTLADVDPAATALAAENVAANREIADGRVRVVTADLLDAAGRTAAGLPPNGFDAVIVNPPYDPADRGRSSPHAARAAAHRIDPGDLDRWMRAAAALLHPQGTLTVIFRADELPRLLDAVTRRFGGLVVLPVHPRLDVPANRVIVKGRPQSAAPFRLLPGFVLHHADGSYRADADAVLRGAALPVDW